MIFIQNLTFRQGSFGETFYIILDGKVQVSQKQKGYIRTLSGSDYFGEKALLNEASVRYVYLDSRQLLK